MITILGVDQSYTGFGYSIHPEDSEPVTLKKSFPLSKYTGQANRLFEIEFWFEDLLEKVNPDLVVMEGYANAVKFGREMSGELGGVVKKATYFMAGIEPLVVPPTVLKKFVTGSGNAPKNVMLQQVYKRWGKEFTDDNMADGFSLGMFGKCWLWPGTPDWTKAQVEVVEKLRKDQKKAG